MGIFDALVGRRSVKGPASRERLFALSTAYVTLETEQSITSAGVAGIVFQPLATSDFTATVKDMEEVVKATAGELGATVESQDDSFGFRWLIVRDKASVEDLVVTINGVSSALEDGGYGEQFGHGLGLGLHERPIISRLNSLDHPVEILPGMVFALETYCPASDGFSAARIEEEVVVTPDGPRILTLFPAQDLIVANPY